MERIREAVERAKELRKQSEQSKRTDVHASRVHSRHGASAAVGARQVKGRVIKLDPQHLEAMRVVADDANNPIARSFEMLRTQLFVKMNNEKLRVIGVTSPAPASGKTVCALNLAFSFARLVQRDVALIDFDFRKPQIAGYLGLAPGRGIESLLRGKDAIGDIAVYPEKTEGRLRILPTFGGSRNPTDLLSSSRLAELIENIKSDNAESIVILDLPPILAVDDVLQLMQFIDIVLMVVVAGETSISQVRDAERVIGRDKPIEYLLNKAKLPPQSSYHHYY